MRPEREARKALQLLDQGLTPGRVSRLLGIPRSTIRAWQLAGIPGSKSTVRSSCPICRPQAGLDSETYAYLLGLYLGDGCISAGARTYRLRIFMDAAYPRIIGECVKAMEIVAAGKTAATWQRQGTQCVVISTYWNHWPCLFPQHGAGKKHERRISLTNWQREIAEEHPRPLVKGLIESDGCRVVADDRGMASLRYHFSNLSEDIKGIYCSALDQLKIGWTRPCAKQIAVYKKADTAKLDTFVGPKT